MFTDCPTENLFNILTFSRKIWKRRCDLIAAANEDTYEARIRNNCESLYLQLKSDSSTLPSSHRYLIHKHPTFFHQRNPRRLQSWLTQVQLAINSRKTRQPQGLHRYFPPQSADSTTSTHSTQKLPPPSHLDSDSDSDDTSCWITQYPDEAPELDTWIDPSQSSTKTIQPNFLHFDFQRLQQALTTTAKKLS